VRWAWAGSRLALTLRRLRSRFGISAPRVAVRTEVAWHWRALGLLLLIALVVGGGRWAYDAGRRIAGFDAGATERELQSLRSSLVQREEEAVRWRAQASAAESTLAIERAAREQLATQVRGLESENGRLREELAVFERLAGGNDSSGTGLSIEQLRIEPPTAGNVWRYRFLVAQKGERGGAPFRGQYQLLLTPQGGGAIIQFPRAGGDMTRQSLEFRHFRRVDGSIDLPEGVAPGQIELRILQQGQVRASYILIANASGQFRPAPSGKARR